MELEIRHMQVQSMSEEWWTVYISPAKDTRGNWKTENYLASFSHEDDAKLFKQAKEAACITNQAKLPPTCSSDTSTSA